MFFSLLLGLKTTFQFPLLLQIKKKENSKRWALQKASANNTISEMKSLTILSLCRFFSSSPWFESLHFGSALRHIIFFFLYPSLRSCTDSGDRRHTYVYIGVCVCMFIISWWICSNFSQCIISHTWQLFSAICRDGHPWAKWADTYVDNFSSVWHQMKMMIEEAIMSDWRGDRNQSKSYGENFDKVVDFLYTSSSPTRSINARSPCTKGHSLPLGQSNDDWIHRKFLRFCRIHMKYAI